MLPTFVSIVEVGVVLQRRICSLLQPRIKLRLCRQYIGACCLVRPRSLSKHRGCRSLRIVAVAEALRATSVPKGATLLHLRFAAVWTSW